MLIKLIDLQTIKIFEKINSSSSDLSKEIKIKSPLLIPYENQGVTFYCDELYVFDSDGYIVFGHDLDGYFIVSVKNKKVYYLYDIDECANFTMMYCNSGINDFIIFNNIFMQAVFKQSELMEKQLLTDDEILSDAMDAIFTQCDSEAMKDDAFWGLRCYELRDGFFPLNDAKIKFYSEMEKGPHQGKSESIHKSKLNKND
ncbi:SUKH-4 family immunity protein [Escherichia coli]|uniref:Uncharacterized protein n=3 Tax=Escherichia coli TaxID=562 RepID=A0A3S4MKS1_ECOLX|nr:SUKH-4 family immunity protein [Escherichia coli]KPO38998.1 hypothetical protein ACU81_09995 [Escherichia coli]MDA6266577.1 SUKH-4 family immunity protein [Escherichia coli]MDY9197480.1 SUKH-4 family immunity protein [Escherichia coli]MDY9209657.1 SUKH-4 family immunity protein [Escherichia coli]MDY9264375.1 SUKH-4 family immunity protein [Escherichia coli]